MLIKPDNFKVRFKNAVILSLSKDDSTWTEVFKIW